MQAMLLITAARYLGELDVGYLNVLQGLCVDQQACHQCRKGQLPHIASRSAAAAHRLWWSKTTDAACFSCFLLGIQHCQCDTPGPLSITC